MQTISTFAHSLTWGYLYMFVSVDNNANTLAILDTMQKHTRDSVQPLDPSSPNHPLNHTFATTRKTTRVCTTSASSPSNVMLHLLLERAQILRVNQTYTRTHRHHTPHHQHQQHRSY